MEFWLWVNLSGVIDVYYNVSMILESTLNLMHLSGTLMLSWHCPFLSTTITSSPVIRCAYLLSGNLKTTEISCCPRLNGDILSITVDSSNELYALYLSNGEMIVLSAIDLMSRLQVAGLNADFVRLPARKKYKNVEDNC